MDRDANRMCELLVGLPEVRVLGVAAAELLTIEIETVAELAGCPRCGAVATGKGRRSVELIDLPCFGRATRLRWRKRRWRCVEAECEGASWTEEDSRIASPRMAMTDRACRWVTLEVGRFARSVSEVASVLGCDWHTVNDAVVAYGSALLESAERFGDVEALGLDEVLFAKLGAHRRAHFATTIVDTRNGQLLDVVPGRGGEAPRRWIEARGDSWRAQVQWATLDLSASFRSVFEAMLPEATLVADPFHVVRHANSKLDECRRRVQNETLGHRGRKHDPLFRSRRLLTLAEERLSDDGRDKLLGLLRAGDPRGEVAAAWHAKEAVRELYAHADEQTATEWIDHLIGDMADETWPVEVRSLERTLRHWRDQIVAWHRSRATNGPTEAANNLVKRVKRAAFGFTSFRNFRIRALLYAGRPDWSLLATVPAP